MRPGPGWGGGGAGSGIRAHLGALVPAGLAVAVAALPAPGGGQAPRPSDPTVLTLEGALARAARHSPDYRAARSETGISDPARRAAWGAFLPGLELGLGTGASFNRRRVSEDFFGNPVENPTTRWETTSSSSQDLGVRLILFEGGRRFRELAAAAGEAAARTAAARAALVEVEARVSRAWLEAMRLRALTAVVEEVLRGRRRDLEVTRRRFELAGVTRVDLLAARQSVGEQEAALRRARAEHRKALLTLRRAIGDPGLDFFALPAAVPAPGDAVHVEVDVLVARALRRNPRVLTDAAEARVAESRVSVAAGSRWPTASVGFRVTQNTFQQGGRGLFDPFPDAGRFATASLRVSVPVFSRFRVRGEVARAEARAESLRERLRRTRLEVEERVRGRWVDLGAARESLVLARGIRELAEERLELARQQYRLGTRTFAELQRDLESSVRARRGAIDALHRVLSAEVDLREAVGVRLENREAPGAG